MSNIEFEEDDLRMNSFRADGNGKGGTSSGSGMAAFLVKNKIVENESQANVLLFTLSVVMFLAALAIFHYVA